ncbi:Rrf2 family transcriptional regulator [Candidatus Peregrinibacteria bacterium]|jgi:Rrf2 family protein|nr:Rrf2 family transcriptional regulator [Candidatus Peregrinibacteria bacterium]MBT7736621.1 Rrf2 family transcriptional regulator [Candidatus Peregrinibacteria bacterium]
MNKIATAPGSKKKSQSSGALHLTKKIDYGIMLLTYLTKCKKGESMSIKSISEEKGLSFSFLQKVARLLQQAGFIKAERGKYGGYVLKKDATKLSIIEVIEALEGPIAIVPCVKHNCARQDCCDIRAGLKRINDDLEDYFKKQTLEKLLS